MSRFFRQAGDSDSESEESDEELMSSGDEDTAPVKPAAPTSKPALSRFLKTAGGDSSSSSESGDDDDDDDDSGDERPQKGKSKFAASDSEGESDGEVKQVVKSAHGKRLEAMEAMGKVMDNALKINDWVAISNGTLWVLPVSFKIVDRFVFPEFDKLARLVQRQSNAFEQVSPFYIRTLSTTEASVNAALAKEKAATKKMNVSNAKALTAMKQKIKKAVKEYEAEIKKYQAVRFRSSDQSSSS
jgi:translation initiation factor 3 subunit C